MPRLLINNTPIQGFDKLTLVQKNSLFSEKKDHSFSVSIPATPHNNSVLPTADSQLQPPAIIDHQGKPLLDGVFKTERRSRYSITGRAIGQPFWKTMEDLNLLDLEGNINYPISDYSLPVVVGNMIRGNTDGRDFTALPAQFADESHSNTMSGGLFNALAMPQLKVTAIIRILSEYAGFVITEDNLSTSIYKDVAFINNVSVSNEVWQRRLASPGIFLSDISARDFLKSIEMLCDVRIIVNDRDRSIKILSLSEIATREPLDITDYETGEREIEQITPQLGRSYSFVGDQYNKVGDIVSFAALQSANHTPTRESLVSENSVLGSGDWATINNGWTYFITNGIVRRGTYYILAETTTAKISTSKMLRKTIDISHYDRELSLNLNYTITKPEKPGVGNKSYDFYFHWSLRCGNLYYIDGQWKVLPEPYYNSEKTIISKKDSKNKSISEPLISLVGLTNEETAAQLELTIWQPHERDGNDYIRTYRRHGVLVNGGEMIIKSTEIYTNRYTIIDNESMIVAAIDPQDPEITQIEFEEISLLACNVEVGDADIERSSKLMIPRNVPGTDWLDMRAYDVFKVDLNNVSQRNIYPATPAIALYRNETRYTGSEHYLYGNNYGYDKVGEKLYPGEPVHTFAVTGQKILSGDNQDIEGLEEGHASSNAIEQSIGNTLHAEFAKLPTYMMSLPQDRPIISRGIRFLYEELRIQLDGDTKQEITVKGKTI